MGRSVSVLLAVAVSACATLQPAPETAAQSSERRARAPRPAYNLSGYPPAARDGYIDGCESAKKSAHGGKDEQRFAADAQYQMGWKDGFSICSRRP